MSGRIMLDSAEERRAQQAPAEEPQPEPQEAPPPPPPPVPNEPPPAPEAPLAAQEGPTPVPEQPPPDWKARIDRLTREKYEARSRLEQTQREWQQWQAQARAAMQPQGQPDARAEALQQFRAEQAERDFNAQCNAVFQKGSAEYADFGDAVGRLNAVGYGNRPDALAAVAAMQEQGHHVYYALAQDLDNAARVLSLPPMQMAMELARMAHERRPDTPTSGLDRTLARAGPTPATRAPAPLRQVGGTSARPEQPLDRVSMAEFIRRRDREEGGGSRRIMR